MSVDRTEQTGQRAGEALAAARRLLEHLPASAGGALDSGRGSKRAAESQESGARVARRRALAAELATKLAAPRSARIAILGQGYVGLPLAARLGAVGFAVLGIETDSERRAAIEGVELSERLLGPGSEALSATLVELKAAGRYRIAGPDEDPDGAAGAPGLALADCDVALVCVPTPLGPDRRPDLSAVRAAGQTLGRTLAAGALVVLESTTYPGTTRGVFRDALEDGCRAAGRPGELVHEFFLAYSPEREDPGRAEAEQRRVPKLVGGLDATAEALALALYSSAFEAVHGTDGAEVAEAAKLFENVFRAVNIALVNEAKVVLEALGIDVWRVLDAAATKPFGFMPFQPGPGLGGHCIPIDPFYFAWAAEEIGVRARFVELAGEVNRAMPEYVTGRLEAALVRGGRELRGARVLLFGLAYKPDVADLRESPALDLVDRLRVAGALVEVVDPHVAGATTPGGAELVPVEPTAARLAAADAVLVVTDHSAFDYPAIAEHARLVVDTRGVMRAFASRLGERLVRA